MGSKLPISPIERHWSGSAFNCRGAYRDWIPESWVTTDPDVSDARCASVGLAGGSLEGNGLSRSYLAAVLDAGTAAYLAAVPSQPTG